MILAFVIEFSALFLAGEGFGERGRMLVLPRPHLASPVFQKNIHMCKNVGRTGI
jgi:hypothetical protein